MNKNSFPPAPHLSAPSLSTIAMTHEAISAALAHNLPLSQDQRAALISFVALDKASQERRHPYGRCTITGPEDEVAFIFRHLPDVDASVPDHPTVGDAKDAARYRWIRATDSWFKEQGMAPDEIDAAVDEAMASHPERFAFGCSYGGRNCGRSACERECCAPRQKSHVPVQPMGDANGH